MSLKMILSGGVRNPSKTSQSEEDFGGMNTSLKTTFTKAEEEQQLVWAEVYVPNVVDAHGDFAGPKVIQKMAYDFLKKGLTNRIDLEHNEVETGAYIVESFIARKNDPDFIEGSWVIGVHVPDSTLWNKIKKGELNGFSFMGLGQTRPQEVEVEAIQIIKGETTLSEGHSHQFEVSFDDYGNLLGGVTTPAEDGHVHLIKGGTRTEEAAGHTHRFSYVEGVLSLEDH